MSAVPIITPINAGTQQRVSNEVLRYITRASEQYGTPFNSIDVLFDLKGKTAGMYRVKSLTSRNIFGGRVVRPLQRVIRFNPWLFAKYPDDSWENTIPHEVAHYIVDCVYGLGRVRPHGKEWQGVMVGFDAVPNVHANYDLSGIPVRKVRRYPYRCLCREVPLTGHRHKKIQQGIQIYRCQNCQGELIFSPPQ